MCLVDWLTLVPSTATQDTWPLPTPLDVVSTDLLLLHHLALWESGEDGLGEKPLLAYEDIDKLTGTYTAHALIESYIIHRMTSYVDNTIMIDTYIYSRRGEM